MFTHSIRHLCAALLIALAAAPTAHAQWAVTDGPATGQLMKQVRTLQQQLQIMNKQLTQAQQALDSMRGARGMERLLSGGTRNYLPTSGAQLTTVTHGGSGGYPRLSAEVRNAITVNAVLTQQRLSKLSPAAQQQIIAGRQSAALQQALANQALINVSSRFAAIQTLIAAIPRARDQKAILELQARISAELGMLQNEQSKLAVLHVATQAQDAVARQQELEHIIDGHGNFESRFQPKL